MTAGLPDRSADRERAVLNTDRELYREDTGDPAGSYYENSVHVTASGSIGMNVGGTVIVRPIEEWHRAALAARPAPDDGEARVYTCRCSSLGLCPEHAAQDAAQDAAPSSPGSGDALRQAVADELARHADTMRWSDNDADPVTVELGCRCGYVRGTVTAKELAADLDGRMRAYRLHVADAVIAVLDGPQSPPSGPGRAEDGGRVASGGSTLRTNNVTTKLGGA